jgi:hypothetical protein
VVPEGQVGIAEAANEGFQPVERLAVLPGIGKILGIYLCSAKKCRKENSGAMKPIRTRKNYPREDL